MIFTWLRSRRRQAIRQQPFPAQWEAILRRHVPQYRLLTADEQAKLRGAIQVFIAEKNWEGCGGLELTDEMKLVIAAYACLLVLGIEEFFFDRVKSILVYPDAYLHPPEMSDGLIHEDAAMEGESWHRGPVILNWRRVKSSGRDTSDGLNLVLHEFAHQLDGLDGATDGVPPLESNQQYRSWYRVTEREFRRLSANRQRGRVELLDHYGATNKAEFFAVATECFFERPRALQRRHAELYRVLADFYRQDPAAWPWTMP